MASCGGCDRVWESLAVAHCGGCHRSFVGVAGFDLHRDRGRCVRHPDLYMEPELTPDGLWGTAEQHAKRERISALGKANSGK